MKSLHRPIAVFDAGIGSYAWAKAIQEAYPQQDIIYFADRASFPYALKTKDELKHIMTSSIKRLADLGAELVIVASNAPSVVVVDEIAKDSPVPVIGCYPPIQAGVAASKTNEIANLGVKVLLASPEFRFYIQDTAPESTVHILNASALVRAVEDGSFLKKPQETEQAVNDYMKELRQNYPKVDVCTLSSTHLPWLMDYFQKAAPDITFINPVQQTVKQIKDHITEGSGQIYCIATSSEEYPLSALEYMFEKLGIQLTINPVN